MEILGGCKARLQPLSRNVRPRKQYPRMSISNRVRTEPLTEAHADELYQGFLDARIYSFIPEQPPQSLEAMHREYREFVEGAPSGSNEVWLNWAVRELSTSQCIGTVQVTVYSGGLLWVGYKLTPSAWSNGYATEAVVWLLAELSGRFSGKTALAAVDTRNIASIRVLEKVGFVRLRMEAATIRGEETQDHVYEYGFEGQGEA